MPVTPGSRPGSWGTGGPPRRGIATEHAIYAAESVLDYPQSGERFRGRAAIAAQRGGHPADRHFAHETQYVADPFDPPASRAGLGERMPDRRG